MQFLFYIRLTLYLLAASLPAFYPGIVVPYDSTSFVAWLIFLPILMIQAFYLKPPGIKLTYGLYIAAATLIIFLIYFGWNLEGLFFCSAGVIVYILTRLIFSATNRGRGAAAIEMFLLSTVYYRLLLFSRASEDVASQTEGWSSIIVLVTIVAFMLHGLVLYLAAFPDRAPEKRRRELVLFFATVIPICLVIVIFVPPDFIRHKIVFNDFFEPPQISDLQQEKRGDERRAGERDAGNNNKSEGKRSGEQKEGNNEANNGGRNGLPLGMREFPTPRSNDSDKSKAGNKSGQMKPESGNRKGRVRRQKGSGGQDTQKGEGGASGQQSQNGSGGQGNEQGKRQKGENSKQKQNDDQQKLQGVPAEKWERQMSSGQGKGKQMALMIVASPVDPIYAAEDYWSDFDFKKGFSIDKKSQLNRIKNARFLETWKNPVILRDKMRKSFDTFFLSVIKERVVPYAPQKIEPTKLDQRYHPFDLSYRATSAISISDMKNWKEVKELSFGKKIEMKKYLKVGLRGAEKRAFKRQLKRALKGRKGYVKRIIGILKSLGPYQYELGFDEDTSVKKLVRFLTRTKTGDCTEFAHSVAILGRMAGIPSRVVTGYVATKQLQTPAHKAGLRILRRKIEPLQKYPLKELYLVTSSHHHAWVQYFLPEYGWIDFETTSFAKPPKPGKDPNKQDVVIPLIETEKNLQNEFLKRKFPWRRIIQVVIVMAISVLLFLFIYRYSRESYYYIRSHGRTPDALAARFRLLLMRLAANGFPLMQFHQTPIEYATVVPHLKKAISKYTTLRYRSFYEIGEKEKAWSEFEIDYSKALRQSRRSGLWSFIRRIFSLRGLYY